MTTQAAEKSIAYNAGRSACEQGIALKDSAILNLRVGCQQYEDFIAGYDSLNAKRQK